MESFHKSALFYRERIRHPENTPADLTRVYDEWSKDGKFDKDSVMNNFGGPAEVAEALTIYLPKRRDVYILDVGAGTGRVAEKLRDLGYTNIDALDPSEGMLELAKRKNLYQKYFCAYFTEQNSGIMTSTYDILLSSGCLIPGHLKCNILPEMVRVVKKGGLVLLVVGERDMFSSQYKDQLEPYMKKLETEGKWTLLERTVFSGYANGENGIRFVFRITQ